MRERDSLNINRPIRRPDPMNSLVMSGWTTLPEKLIVTPDVYTEEMDAVGDFTHTGASLVVNNIQFHSGDGSLKITSNSVGTFVDIRKDVNWDLSAGEQLSFKLWAYPHSNLTTTITQINLFAFSGDGYDNVWIMNFSPDGGIGTALLLAGQWNLLNLKSIGLWSVGSGNPTWDNITKFWIRVYKDEGSVAEISFDNLSIGIVKKPSILLMFDDGNVSDYTKAYPLIKAKNMVATSYLVSSLRTASNLTDSQLIELNANKWDIANHTVNHPLVEGAMTVQDFIDEMEGCRAYLDNIGLTRSSKHIGATGSAWCPDWITAATQWGAKTLRPGSAQPNIYGEEFPFGIRTNAGNSSTTLQYYKTYIDLAIAAQWTPIITFHRLVDSAPDTYDWLVSDYSLLLDYIELLGLQTLTIDEYYRLNSGDIRVNHR